MTALLATLLLAGGLSVPAGAVVINPPVSTVPASEPTAVFFVPHADDDVLSMGVYMNELVRLGVDVHVVYYTDGAATGVCSPQYVSVPASADYPQGSEEECRANWSAAPAGQNWYGQPVSAFVADRDAEFRNSVEALGVPQGNIEIYTGPNGTRRRDGTVDVAYAVTMLEHYRAIYPTSTFVTMSWLDAHPDHASAGQALRQLVETDPGEFEPDDAIFTLARWYWPYAYPDRSASLSQAANSMRAARGYPLADELARCLDTTCETAEQQALHAYQEPYDIGYRSVPDYLDVASQDPAVLLHGVDVGRYQSTVAVTKARRPSVASTMLTVSGTLAVIPMPGVTYPVSQNNADGLAQGFNPATTLHPASTVALRALSPSGAVLGTGSATVVNNSYSGVLRVPAGAVTVAASVVQTPGTDAAIRSIDVQTLRESVASARGVSLTRGTLTAGYGQPLTMAVTVRRRNQGVAGSVVRVTLSGPAGKPISTASGTTGASGTAVVHPVLTAAGTVAVSDGVPGTAVVAAAAADQFRVALRPAVLSVLPKARTVSSSAKQVRVIGSVRGHNYMIPAGVMRPVTLTAWMILRGHRTVLRQFVTSRGGAFSVVLPMRGSGRVYFDVAALAGTYAARAAAGFTTMRQL